MLEKEYALYYAALIDTDRERARGIIDSSIDRGVDPADLILKVIAPSMEELAEEFVDKTATLAQHFLSSTISGEIVEDLLQRFESAPERKGVVIIGTAAGDFHGLGKKIVSGFLKSALYEIVDLGTNVQPQEFMKTAEKYDSAVIGVSSMMAHTALGEDGAKGVRRLIDSAGCASRYKLVVGGAPYKFDPDLWRETGADAWAADGNEAIAAVRSLFAGMAPA
jgi:trimethylamine corrinoid protein